MTHPEARRVARLALAHLDETDNHMKQLVTVFQEAEEPFYEDQQNERLMLEANIFWAAKKYLITRKTWDSLPIHYGRDANTVAQTLGGDIGRVRYFIARWEALLEQET